MARQRDFSGLSPKHYSSASLDAQLIKLDQPGLARRIKHSFLSRHLASHRNDLEIFGTRQGGLSLCQLGSRAEAAHLNGARLRIGHRAACGFRHLCRRQLLWRAIAQQMRRRPTSQLCFKSTANEFLKPSFGTDRCARIILGSEIPRLRSVSEWCVNWQD